MAKDDDDPGQIALRWWGNLQSVDAKGNARKGDRAALARLRRYEPREAMAEEATLQLFRALGRTKPEQLLRVATLAGVLAGVREHDRTRKFARAIGPASLEKKDIEQAPLRKLRFQRLIEAREEDEIARAFRRAIDIIGRKADVADLARIILAFDFDATRQRLTFDYYNASLAAPDNTDAPDDDASDDKSDD